MPEESKRPDHKICKRCGIKKPLSEFYLLRRMGTQRNALCKPCSREACQEYRANNKESLIAWRKKYDATANGKKKKAESHRKYYEKNKERIKKRQDEWRRKPGVQERLSAKSLAWTKTPTGHAYSIQNSRFQAHKRKARLKNIPGDYTKEDIDRIFTLQKGRCAICKTKLKSQHIDHIIPISKEGSTNNPSNIQLLCPPCNIRKKDRDPITHMRSLGMLL